MILALTVNADYERGALRWHLHCIEMELHHDKDFSNNSLQSANLACMCGSRKYFCSTCVILSQLITVVAGEQSVGEAVITHRLRGEAERATRPLAKSTVGVSGRSRSGCLQRELSVVTERRLARKSVKVLRGFRTTAKVSELLRSFPN